MKPDKIPVDSIEIYLLHVRNKLQDLPSAQISEILAELRSHILDSVSCTNVPITDATIREALEKLGPPETLAALYLTENLMVRAEASRSPWLVMQTLFRLAMKSVWALAAFMVSFFGYGSAVAFFVCAIAKPFYPNNVGLWWDTNRHLPTGLSFIFPTPPGREVLGWWMIPLGLVLCVVLFVATTRFVRWNIRRIRRSRRTTLNTQTTLVSQQTAS